MSRSNYFPSPFARWMATPRLTVVIRYHMIYLMTATATILYRSPERIFSAADRGEKVIIRRGKTEYVLTRKVGQGSLYGCLRGAIRHDAGKPKVRWKAIP